MVPGQITGTLENLLQIGTGLGLLVCALFMVVAGFAYMTSGGSPSKIEQAKSAALNAAIGFALILSARVIGTMINNVVVR